MRKSDKDIEIEKLKTALKREQDRNAKLKDKHEADKRKIKNLKRRKDPESKKDRKRATRKIMVTEEQRRLLSSLLQGIDILS